MLKLFEIHGNFSEFYSFLNAFHRLQSNDELSSYSIKLDNLESKSLNSWIELR
jgi:hypothetical protein